MNNAFFPLYVWNFFEDDGLQQESEANDFHFGTKEDFIETILLSESRLRML